MHKLDTIKNIYFIGIGGIGMSALARYFVSKGCKVSGYDKTETILTQALTELGINIHYEDNTGLIDTDASVVVYTPAIPESHSELTYYRNNGYEVVKRSDVLGWITEGTVNICVAGTHGKTTVSTMVAHVLRDSGYGCTAFLGGIAANYNTNFWSSDNNVVVVEADEYDRSFLKLNPSIAVITSMDADHLDIYKTSEALEDAFVSFSKKVKPNGLLLAKKGLAREASFDASILVTYHLHGEGASIYAKDITVVDGAYHFTAVGPSWTIENIVLHMGGLHNIENALVAVSVAMHLGIEPQKIKVALANFAGVKRRFEYLIKTDTQILIDDYAHHPAELAALISGVRSLYPNGKLTLVFQPHLFSRTQDLCEGFAASLSAADEIVLLPIYPARELPIPGVTSEMIIGKMTNKNVVLLQKEALQAWVKEHQPKLLVMAGAGDIDVLIRNIKNDL
ncbi:MAG: UDP-N-acetylmuramate--L-alanine ligase [Bacteroidetes bacterium]|nr:UDP-N-acetylmuramate--L-alanine ligase [Bacteroidota bacterium]